MTADINRTIYAKKAIFSWYSTDSSEIKSKLKYKMNSSKVMGVAAGDDFLHHFNQGPPVFGRA